MAVKADVLAPMMSGLFTGFGNYMIIQQAMNYLLDVYLHLSVFLSLVFLHLSCHLSSCHLSSHLS